MDEIIGQPIRSCTRCLGSKVSSYDKSKACVSCAGVGQFTQPDIDVIRQALSGRGGKLRSVKPKDNRRAAYVWRMARFHGGKDVTMPVMASYDVMGDAFVRELDILSEQVAIESFGSDINGTMRWARAFGMV